MTISNDYQNVADWLAGHALRWQPLEPLQCAHLAQVLLGSSAERVKHLIENMLPLRLDSLPEVRSWGFTNCPHEAPRCLLTTCLPRRVTPVQAVRGRQSNS